LTAWPPIKIASVWLMIEARISVDRLRRISSGALHVEAIVLRVNATSRPKMGLGHLRSSKPLGPESACFFSASRLLDRLVLLLCGHPFLGLGPVSFFRAEEPNFHSETILFESVSRINRLLGPIQTREIALQRASVPLPSGFVSASTRVGDRARFQRALQRFDEENSKDPNIELAEEKPWPRERLYAERLYDWVLRLDPNASETLLLAARSQHICRWMIPRNKFEMTKAGYLKWRNELKKFHAQKAGEILKEVGYPDETINAVQALNLKKNFPDDPESRTLEDALCLVFLQFQFADLARKTSDDQVVNALKKSWNKMTPAAREEALKLPYAENESRLLKLALS
jgi:hypothetical protein